MADRRESVTLVLNDQMTAQLGRASAAKKAFDRGMDGRAVSSFGRDMDIAGDDINRFSGRLRVILNAATAIGPAFVPIAGVAVPALAGLASQLGFTVVAAGAVVGAFQGVGDALKAVDAAALEPTAENLAKAQKALEDLAPAGRELVAVVDGQLQPALRELRDIGQENLFPGVIDGIESLLTRAPEFGRIMEELTRAPTSARGSRPRVRTSSSPTWSVRRARRWCGWRRPSATCRWAWRRWRWPHSR
jgi:hypothetical protein